MTYSSADSGQLAELVRPLVSGQLLSNVCKRGRSTKIDEGTNDTACCEQVMSQNGRTAFQNLSGLDTQSVASSNSLQEAPMMRYTGPSVNNAPKRRDPRPGQVRNAGISGSGHHVWTWTMAEVIVINNKARRPFRFWICCPTEGLPTDQGLQTPEAQPIFILRRGKISMFGNQSGCMAISCVEMTPWPRRVAQLQ